MPFSMSGFTKTESGAAALMDSACIIMPAAQMIFFNSLCMGFVVWLFSCLVVWLFCCFVVLLFCCLVFVFVLVLVLVLVFVVLLFVFANEKSYQLNHKTTKQPNNIPPCKDNSFSRFRQDISSFFHDKCRTSVMFLLFFRVSS